MRRRDRPRDLAHEAAFSQQPDLVKQSTDDLWAKAIIALEKGDFSRLESMLGGPDGFDRQIVEWCENGRFESEPEMLAESLSCACMLGRTETARYLLDKGVDPYAGMKTWLAGPHYAVSSGHFDTVQMLIDKEISLEIKNVYGGTMLGQALLVGGERIPA